MKGPYDVTFADGSVERVEADSADLAKGLAKNLRLQLVDPGGTKARSGLAADILSDARVKIARVAEAVGALVCYLLAGHVLLGLVQAGGDVGPILEAGVLEMMAFQGTAIGATLAAMTAVTGDSAQVQFFPDAKKAWLLQLWTDVQVAGTVRLRSPKFHDNVNGLRFDTVISDLTPLLPFGARQPLQSGDTLVAELAGSAVAGDIEFLVLLRYFEELSQQHSRLITADELMKRAVNYITVENTITTPATGLWGGGESVTAEIDQVHTRKQYAIVGYHVDTECAAVAYRGPDFANVRCGGPGDELRRHQTVDWFLRLAKATGLALIPVFQSDNDAATIIEALQDENGADTTVSTILAELSPQ